MNFFDLIYGLNMDKNTALFLKNYVLKMSIIIIIIKKYILLCNSNIFLS